MDKETPISKYLATLERRQAQREREHLFGSPSPPGGGSGRLNYLMHSPEFGSANIVNIRQQLRFDDETFLQPHDESVMILSPPPHPPSATSSSQQQPQHRLLSSNARSTMMLAPSSVGLGFGGSSSNAVSSTTRSDGMVTMSSGHKRKRYSFEDREDEDHIKKICELEKLLRQTNGDLVEARALTARLEKQKLDLRTESSEKALNYDKSMNEMRIKCRDALDKFEGLERDKELKTKQCDELKEELRRQTSQHSEKMYSLESKVAELQKENLELKQKYEEEKFEQSSNLQKMSDSLHEADVGKEQWSIECQILKEKLELKETIVTKQTEEIKSAQIQLCHYSEVSHKLADSTTAESQIQSLTADVKKYENLFIKEQADKYKLSEQIAKLTEENGYLKTSMNKEMLLEEQVSSLEADCRYLRSVVQAKSKLEVDKDTLSERLRQWTTIAQNIDANFTTPSHLTRYLGQMQTESVEMRHENTTLNCRIESLNRDIQRLQGELGTSKQKELTLAKDRERIENELKASSRRLTLVTKDRDNLVTLKESYESELGELIASTLKNRVAELEGLVREYEQVVNDENRGHTKCFECEKRIVLISQLRSELERAKSERRTDFSFGTTMMDDGDTTKVVAFSSNPSTLSLEQRLKELGSDNERLSNKVKELENQTMAGPSDAIIAEQNKMTDEKLRTLERKHQILCEAYDYETQQLQTAISKLFGYHIILNREPQSQYRLQSTFSGSPQDELIFQDNENDVMLLETPVLNNFREEIDRLLIREGSIPAFMATVTLAFCNGQVAPSDDADISQLLPSSQQSVDPAAAAANEIVPIVEPSSRMVEVEVEGHTDDEDEEDEDEGDEEEEEDDQQHSDINDEDMEEEQSEYDEEDEDAQAEEDDDNGEQGNDDVVYIDSD